MGKSRLKILGLVLAALLLLTIILGSVAYVGFQKGNERRIDEARDALASAVANQMKLAESDVVAGNYQRAEARIEWILNDTPDHAEALALKPTIDAVLSAGKVVPTPIAATPEPTGVPIPTVTAADSATGGAQPVRAFANLEKLIEAEAWEDAVNGIKAFQLENSAYKRFSTDSMLYEAYAQLGRQQITGDRVELGVFYLNEAEKLGPLSETDNDLLIFADLYSIGLSYYEINWDVSISNFRPICDVAPFFQDACERLRISYISYGDQWLAAGEACPAKENYSSAWRLETDDDLSAKLREAGDKCALATPTPTATPLVEGVIIIDGTPVLVTPTFEEGSLTPTPTPTGE